MRAAHFIGAGIILSVVTITSFIAGLAVGIYLEHEYIRQENWHD